MLRSRKAAIAALVALFFISYIIPATAVTAENITVNATWSPSISTIRGHAYFIPVTFTLPSIYENSGQKYTVSISWGLNSTNRSKVGNNITWIDIFNGEFVKVIYIGSGNWSKAAIKFYFRDSNGNPLNNVSVFLLPYGQTNVGMAKFLGNFSSGQLIVLNKSIYTFIFRKAGYIDVNTTATVNANIVIYATLTKNIPSTGGGSIGGWTLNITQENLTYNFTSNWTSINGYAKAFMQSGGSFGNTIKLILLNDAPIRLLLPQLLMLAIVIFILVQTKSPLAGLAGALAMQAMFLELLGQSPSLRNSQLMFGLIVFLVAWTLWDLFYNYSRET